MSWKDEVEELEKRKKLSYRMGGEKNVQRQHELGKLTARERIEALTDPDSFRRGVSCQENPDTTGIILSISRLVLFWSERDASADVIRF